MRDPSSPNPNPNATSPIRRRLTIARSMGIVAAVAVACRWPAVIVVPAIVLGPGLLARLRWPRWGTSLAAVAGALYFPFGWLLIVGNGSEMHRRGWITAWPILPGILPGAWLFHPRDELEFAAMGVATIVLLAGLTWAGSRGPRSLAVASAVALLLMIPSTLFAYAALRF